MRRNDEFEAAARAAAVSGPMSGGISFQDELAKMEASKRIDVTDALAKEGAPPAPEPGNDAVGKNFFVCESLKPFYYSDSYVHLAVGPVGSTKTTVGILKLLRQACRMAPGPDGVRRSRVVWVRNTREQLRDTSITDVQKWLPPEMYGVYRKSEMTYVLRFNDGHYKVELTLWFRSLEDREDMRKLLSLQASSIVFEEFREIDPEIFAGAQTRIRRFPDTTVNGVGCVVGGIPGRPDLDGQPNGFIWGMSNMPDADTFWDTLIHEPPPNVQVTMQPGGMDPSADWKHLLHVPNYYENMILSNMHRPKWVDVYVHCKRGHVLAGDAVYEAFDRNVHVADEELVPDPWSRHPIYVGADAGLSPAACIGEMTQYGRLMVYDSLHASGMGAEQFVQQRVKPLILRKYGNRPVVVAPDPAGFNRSETDERTVAQIYRNAGFNVMRPSTNNSITARLSVSTRFMIQRMTDHQPCLCVCPVNAAGLVAALAGAYKYRYNLKGVKDDKPEKSHPHSDYADAYQYLCLAVLGGTGYVGTQMAQQAPEFAPEESGGWT